MKSRFAIVISIVTIMLMMVACGNQQGNNEFVDKDENNTDMNEEEITYECISQEEAKKLMDTESNYIILDVRTIEEFESGHIPNAICISNETIDTAPPTELPDKDQLILIYCRSGNRSKQASEKLVKMGYTNIKEFGGIKTWKWDVTE